MAAQVAKPAPRLSLLAVGSSKFQHLALPACPVTRPLPIGSAHLLLNIPIDGVSAPFLFCCCICDFAFKVSFALTFFHKAPTVFVK